MEATTVAFIVGALVLACLCIGAGVLAYRGVWRSWVNAFNDVQIGRHSRAGFASLYFGFALLAVPIASASALWPDLGAIAINTAITIAAAAGIICLLSLAWLPRFLQPRWYNEWLDSGANPAALYRTSDSNRAAAKQKGAS